MPELSIGLVGHVDHGKTSLTQGLTGKWADTHSEEVKRGITIRLGYADVVFNYCKNCKSYAQSQKCQKCFEDTEPRRAVSFIDAPGHETLMATVLSGASLMDGALLIIAANEKCPQPQTAEHLKTLDVIGIKNIVIVQNKIDLVSEQKAIDNYNEIKQFVKGTVAENAPIVPVSAIHNINIDSLIQAIEEFIPTPERDIRKDPIFYIARSFDVNKPGTEIEKLSGAVFGGSVTSGILRTGDKIEIKPGIKIKEKWMPLKTEITDMIQMSVKITEAKPGGLIAIQTELDPFLSKSDNLAGNIIGLEERLPPVTDNIRFKTELFDAVIGIKNKQRVAQLKPNDILMLTIAIAKTVGVVTSSVKNIVQAKLKLPVCVDKGARIAISTQVGGRWHLIGYGIVE